MSSAARRRYNRSSLTLLAVYFAVLIGVSIFFNTGTRTGVIAYAAAALPALPVIGIFYALGRYLVEEQDEYLRMLLIRRMLWATGFALSVATVWGFLERFGLALHFDAYAVMILWFFGLGLGACIEWLIPGSSGASR